jgi:hypothetical protein
VAQVLRVPAWQALDTELKSQCHKKKKECGGGGWVPVAHICVATQEAEIRRIVVHSQPGQIVRETLSQKTLHKNRASGVAQGEFKPQYCKKKKKKKNGWWRESSPASQGAPVHQIQMLGTACPCGRTVS